ncbi:hypothetical protein ACHHYP_17049 [Achlya hypogyna]|uniref:Uncharacterized protein n=1 Tax=Achlya hypogyna TaxID=1202772 RepID=A0A1V9Y5F8_ACHHY|nr:hypothetical protein ACHHYP_17049 [Achlya hypogyna]
MAAKAWATLKTPFVRSPSDRAILVNPELVDAVAMPLQRVKAKAHHVLPVEGVERRLQSLRRHAADEKAPWTRPLPPLCAFKALLPKTAEPTTRIALEDLMREIEIDKKILAEQGPELLAECERKLADLVSGPQDHVQRVLTLLQQFGLDEHALMTLLATERHTAGSMRQLALLQKVVETAAIVDAPLPVLYRALTRDAFLVSMVATVRTPARVSIGTDTEDAARTVPQAASTGVLGLKSTPERGVDLIRLLKSIAKGSGQGKESQLLPALTHLANDVLDERVELVKLSLNEAGVACHALYTSLFFLLVGLMMCALTVFLLSLAVTQFLTTYVSYLDSLWITTSVALVLGLVCCCVGIGIFKRTMVEVRTLLLAPQELKRTRSFTRKKKTPDLAKAADKDDDFVVSGITPARRLAMTDPTPPLSDDTEEPRRVTDAVQVSTSAADSSVSEAAQATEAAASPRTTDGQQHGASRQVGIKRLPSITECESEFPEMDEGAIADEVRPLLAALVSLVDSMSSMAHLEPTMSDTVVDIPRQNSDDLFVDAFESAMQTEVSLLQEMAASLVLPLRKAIAVPPMRTWQTLAVKLTAPPHTIFASATVPLATNDASSREELKSSELSPVDDHSLATSTALTVSISETPATPTIKTIKLLSVQPQAAAGPIRRTSKKLRPTSSPRVHGNELSGVQVVEHLKQHCPPLIAGSLTLILGNPKAIAINERGSLPHADLNRCFTLDVETSPSVGPFFYEEQRARELAPYLRTSDLMLDLHATNKPSEPFLKLAGTLSQQHYDVSRWFPCDTILHDVHHLLAGKVALSDEFVGAHGGVGLIYESGLASDTSRVAALTRSVLKILAHEAKVIALADEAAPPLQKTNYQIAEVFRLPACGFEWLHGHGSHNFEYVLANEPIGQFGDGTVLHVDYDAHIVFPKVPSLWKESAYACLWAGWRRGFDALQRRQLLPCATRSSEGGLAGLKKAFLNLHGNKLVRVKIVAEAQRLRDENAFLRQEVELFRGVISVMKEDLNVKAEQIEHIYKSLKATMMHKAQTVEANQKVLEAKVSHLECVLRAKDISYARVRKTLQEAQARLLEKAFVPFEWVVDDLAYRIFGFLDAASLCAAAAVQRSWYSLVMVDGIWEAVYKRQWPLPQQPSNPENPAMWLDQYRERHLLDRNWANGKAVITTLCGHTGTVTCLQFDDSQLISGSDDGSLMLWSLAPTRGGDSGTQSRLGRQGHLEGLDTSALDRALGLHVPPSVLAQQHHRQTRTVYKLHSFYGHGGPVWALHMHGDRLVSGSYDKTVKLWNLQTGSCVGTLRAHTGWVSSLDVLGSRIASGSWDSSINLWDADTGDLLRTLVDAPANPIYCLKWESTTNAIVAGCRSHGIQVWDAEAGVCTQTFTGHVRGNQVNGVKANGMTVLSGGSDATVKVWDRRDSSCTHTLLGHAGAVMCVDGMRDHKVLSGSYDMTIKHWDLRRAATPVTSVQGHSSAVFALQIDDTKIISGSADSTLKLFNFQH